MKQLVVGLLADTHLPHRLKQLPTSVLDALRGVDVILHAGDVDDPAALKPLETIAPVHAVRGNWHPFDLSDGGAALPVEINLQLAGRRVVLTHGAPVGLNGLAVKAMDFFGRMLGVTTAANFNRYIAYQLAQRYPQADIIVFGHSHCAYVERVGAALAINPGAVCFTPGEPSTIARLRLERGTPQVEILPVLTATH
jgi:hypothetical protein